MISEKNLNLKKISLGDDIYLKYWINQIYPIYNPAYIYQKFCQENSWIAGYFNSSQAILPPLRRKIEKSKINLLAFLNLPLFNFLERLAKIFQLAVLPKDLKNLTNRDGRVIINDQMLKFHPNDRREEYRKMFEKKLASLGY